MRTPPHHLLPCVALLSACGSVFAQTGGRRVVSESARDIPVVAEVDVVVVGGSTGGAAAAVEAAKRGSSVLLITPWTYLGDDLCATYRLWLEPGEEPSSPLAKEMFSHPKDRRGLRFSYEADMPSAGVHEDTDPPTMLNDGRWGNAFNQSVQYDGDVTVTADLGESRTLRETRFMFFQGPNDYEVATVDVELSEDGTAWRPAGTMTNEDLGKGSHVHSALELALPLSGEARHVRVRVAKGPKAKRVLIGEVRIHAEPEAGPPDTRYRVTTPMQVKRTLDQALLDAGVRFLFGCYATGVLRDREGAPAGITMVNRAGRQAVRAKAIVDATSRAWLARSAGVAFEPYPSGPRRFTRIVAGGEPRSGKGVVSRRLPLGHAVGGRPPAGYGSTSFSKSVQAKNVGMEREVGDLIEYTLTLPMRDASLTSFAEAEQTARDLTFDPQQLDESSTLFEVPPDPMRGKRRLTGAWPGADRVDLAAFRPASETYLFVLGGCADIARDAAEAMLRPLEYMALGERVGAAAAAEAAGRPQPVDVRLTGTRLPPATAGDTRDLLAGLRPGDTDLPVVRAEGRSVPVLATVDVVVVGGGTSGAPAAIAAARQGAKTLVVEVLHGLGGVGTTGLIGIYCAGYREGFTAELDAGVKAIGSPVYVVGKMEWWRREIRRAGGTIWFGVLGCGAFAEGDRIKGVVVAAPQGRGVVLADVVIDGTGHADIAAAAGAVCSYTDGNHLGIQGAGLPRWEPGASYINTDWTYVDDSDMIDVWSAFVTARKQNQGAYDLAQLIDTRERRRIVGDYVLSPLDIVNRRTFPDTIGISSGGRLDKHGQTVHPYYLINNHLGGISYTPYRCLLPEELDGILVVGLGVSAHCDAIPSIRMQPCMQNLGYAAGVAAAMAAHDDIPPRAIDVKALQGHLVSNKCLTPDVLAHRDSHPLPALTISNAVTTLADKDYSKLGIIMAERDRALPLLRAAYGNPELAPEARLRCAHVLGMMGDPTGAPTLVEAVTTRDEFDSENISRYFPNLTWLDSYIIALGRSRDTRAVDPVLSKLDLLIRTSEQKTSHYWAIARALEALADPRAAKPLADLLKACGGDERAVTSIEEALTGRRGKSGRRDIAVARALYRCGDHEGLGEKVLRTYAQDLRGHFARHAQAVLQGAPGR